MHDSNASGNKSIKEVEKLRSRVAKLEQVNRKLAKPKSFDGELDRAWTEWEKTFDATKDSIMVIDSESKIIQANLATSRLLGKPLENIVGKTCWQVVHEIEKPREECLLKKVLYSNNHEETELYLPEKDIWLQVSVDPILDDQDNINKIVHIMRDITRRKRIRKALEESEEKYREIVELAPDAIVTVDLKGTIRECNNTLYEQTGYSRDEFLGRHFSKIPAVRIQDISKYQKIFDSLLKGKVPEPFEFMWIHKDRTEHWGEIRVGVLKRDGKTTGFQAVIRDITDRKKVDYALHVSEEKYRGLFENAGEGIITLDLDGKVVEVNKLAEEYGFNRDELIGRRFFEFVPEYEMARCVRDFQTLVAGSPVQGQMDMITPKGIRIAEYKDTPIVRAGEVIGVQAILTDITERKKAEEAYHSLVDHSLQGLAIFQNGRVVFANQAMAQIIGYPVEEMLASPPEKVQAFVHPDDRELVWNRHKVRLNGEKPPEQYEFRGIRKDGSICWLEIHASLIEFQGKPAIQAAYVDITQRKKAEDARAKSEQELRIRNRINNIFLTVPDEKMYAEVLNLVLEVMESEFGTFGYFKEDGAFVVPAMTRNIFWEKCNVPEKDIIFERGTFSGTWGKAIKERKTLFSNEGPGQTHLN